MVAVVQVWGQPEVEASEQKAFALAEERWIVTGLYYGGPVSSSDELYAMLVEQSWVDLQEAA